MCGYKIQEYCNGINIFKIMYLCTLEKIFIEIFLIFLILQNLSVLFSFSLKKDFFFSL